MKVRELELKGFKRFTHLVINGIPETVRLVVLVGSNGCGKTSLLEAFNHYFKYCGFGSCSDRDYLIKQEGGNQESSSDLSECVKINFYDKDFARWDTNSFKGHFYFRSAYRNEPEFKIESITRQGSPVDHIQLASFIQNDLTVSKNYQRMVSRAVSEMFKDENSGVTVRELREQLVGRVKQSLNNIFDDLNLCSVGEPLEDGTFFFNKGSAHNFNYKNLSAGEKAVFDLILDIVIQEKYYQDAIYCIDEPEVHMHTALQGKVIRELYNLIPEKSQLWITTHSIGMINEAEELERSSAGSVAFIDLGSRNFDEETQIQPSKIQRTLLNKFYELAFGEFSKLMIPQFLIICEGTSKGRKRVDFDREVYEKIFSSSHPEAFFVSGGSCSEIENIENVNGGIINFLLGKTKYIKLIDRDDRSEEQIIKLKDNKTVVLRRRNIESYVFDNEIIRELCFSVGKEEAFEKCKEIIENALNKSKDRGNPSDDYKSARGDIYTGLKQELDLKQCGNDPDSFIRDTLAPLFKSDMIVFKELESEIFCIEACSSPTSST